MRLWSIHLKYLDASGLVAVWREALLAKSVLQGRTRGYKNHPQLNRFKEQKKPLLFINAYLAAIRKEACKRGYCFDKKKIGRAAKKKMPVTRGQLEYEFKRLMKKLRKRSPEKYRELLKVTVIKSSPVFKAVSGGVESWEKTK
ncbi:MAG: pyrimidine dimer DNA glycosylase/endonuclease V [archaeon]